MGENKITLYVKGLVTERRMLKERRNGFQNRKGNYSCTIDIHLLLNYKESTGVVMFVAKKKGSRKILAC